MVIKYSKTKKQITLHKNSRWAYKCDHFSTAKYSGLYYYGESKGNSLIIPINSKNGFLMIKQYRYLKRKLSIEFPCGWIIKEKNPILTAKKELIEETGYITGKIKKIGGFEALAGSFKNTCTVFLAKQLTKKHSDIGQKNEMIMGLKKVNANEIEKLIGCGKIWSGQTLAAWTIYKNYIKNHKK